MEISTYDKANEIREKLINIERVLHYYEQKNSRLLEIGVSDKSTYHESTISFHTGVPLKYEQQLKDILLSYKKELETEFEEL